MVLLPTVFQCQKQVISWCSIISPRGTVSRNDVAAWHVSHFLRSYFNICTAPLLINETASSFISPVTETFCQTFAEWFVINVGYLTRQGRMWLEWLFSYAHGKEGNIQQRESVFRYFISWNYPFNFHAIKIAILTLLFLTSLNFINGIVVLKQLFSGSGVSSDNIHTFDWVHL